MKTKVFHFSRLQGLFNPSPLNLSSLGGPIFTSKNSWKYLRFIFDRKLTFHQYVDFYSNKVLLSVKCMKLLGNSSRSITPLQKQLLYRCCVLSITLYGFQLWFYKCAPLVYLLKVLGKMQRKVAIWILGAFKTSLTEGIEAITGLISIKYHLQKFGSRLQLHATSLPSNHIIQTLMDSPFSSPHYRHPSSLSFFTDQQKAKIKSYLVDSSNRAYGIFPFFSLLHLELSPGVRIINTFSNHFSFNHSGKNDNQCF